MLVGGSVADGGTWQTTEVTWDTSYNVLWDDEDKGSYSDGVLDYRDYVITPVEETNQVWGVRLIGSAREENEYGIMSGDMNGYVSCTEFQISGNSSITDSIDLSTNLALNQIPIWTVATANPGRLTDGVIDISSNNDTYGGSPSSEEFAGVMFLTPQSNVAAIGSCATVWADGGVLTPESLDVQYTTDNGNTWMSVTGLDLGRYADDVDDLRDWATAYGWYNLQSHLFTFDPITEEIDGIRMIGESYNNPSAGDPNGFIAMLELEVFASTGGVPPQIPGDANHDRKVDGSDVTILAGNWQYGVSDGNTATWNMGDFNGDGKVDGSDVTILAGNWQYGVTAASASIPEPSTLLLLLGGIAMLGLIRRSM